MFWRTTRESVAQVRQLYERALELDPQYAAAMATLGWVTLIEWISQWTQDPQAVDRAYELARRAVELEDNLPLTHRVLGWVYLWRDHAYERAIAEGERAIAISPNDADGYTWLGHILKFTERAPEAVALVEQAMRMNPHYPILYLFELGAARYMAGQYEEAVAPLKETVRRNPDFIPVRIGLASIYGELGREEEARVEGAEVLRISPNFSLAVHRQRVPLKDPAKLERFLAALRKAGLE